MDSPVFHADEFSSQRRFLMAVGAGLTLAVVLALAWSVRRIMAEHNAARNWVEHTHEVVAKLDDYLETLQVAQGAQREFVVTGNETNLEPYARAIGELPAKLDVIAKLTADNERQQIRVAELRELQSARLQQMANTIRARREDGLASALARIGTGAGRQTSDQISAVLHNMRQDENRLLAERRTDATEVKSLLSVVIGGLILLAGLLMVVIITMLVWIKRLHAGLITICAWTRQVQYGNEWVPVEEYLQRRFGLSVSHGISTEGAKQFLAGEQPPSANPPPSTISKSSEK